MMNYYGEKEESILKDRLEQSKKKGLDLNNLGIVRGMVWDELIFCHEYRGVKYYKTRLEIIRPNIENKDFVPVMVSERLIPNILDKIKKGKFIEVCGEFRSYNKMGDDGKSHVELFLYAQEINFYSDKEDVNAIYLHGFVCKDVVFRETPYGIKIADIILAANRPKCKSDYIPCIAWWNVAKRASDYKIGQEVEVFGRIQSRIYPKKMEGSEEKILKEAYELSISSLKEV